MARLLAKTQQDMDRLAQTQPVPAYNISAGVSGNTNHPMKHKAYMRAD